MIFEYLYEDHTYVVTDLHRNYYSGPVGDLLKGIVYVTVAVFTDKTHIATIKATQMPAENKLYATEIQVTGKVSYSFDEPSVLDKVLQFFADEILQGSEIIGVDVSNTSVTFGGSKVTVKDNDEKEWDVL